MSGFFIVFFLLYGFGLITFFLIFGHIFESSSFSKASDCFLKIVILMKKSKNEIQDNNVKNVGDSALQFPIKLMLRHIVLTETSRQRGSLLNIFVIISLK